MGEKGRFHLTLLGLSLRELRAGAQGRSLKAETMEDAAFWPTQLALWLTHVWLAFLYGPEPLTLGVVPPTS